MTRPLSLYLDLVRFAAAFAVFMSHASWDVYTNGLLWQLRPLGSDAVTVFFVLSGFVVAYAAETRERSARAYAISRLARLHSGAVPAILLTVVADHVGLMVRPGIYHGFASFHAEGVGWQVANALLFTHEWWSNNVQPGTNVPYWSVGYEAMYYVAFGVLMFAPPRWALLGAAAVLAIAGPDTAKLAPMWLLGAGVWRLCRGGPALPPRLGLLLWGASLVWLLGVVLPLRVHMVLFAPMTGDPMFWVDLAHYYLVALTFALNLLGLHAAGPLLAPAMERLARPARFLGARTFTLYLIHMPLMHLIVALSPFPSTSAWTRGAIYLLVPLAALGFAEVSELRKDAWRRLYDRVLPGRPTLERTARAG